MLPLGRELWREALDACAATKVGRAAAAQGIELPQLVAQQVTQGGASHGAAEVGQQQVSAGTQRHGRQAEELGFVRAAAAAAAADIFGLHDGRQLAFDRAMRVLTHGGHKT